MSHPCRSERVEYWSQHGGNPKSVSEKYERFCVTRQRGQSLAMPPLISG